MIDLITDYMHKQMLTLRLFAPKQHAVDMSVSCTYVCIYSVSIDLQSVTFKRYISYSMLYQNTLCHGWSWA